jgi:predicted pyridoxine 5'-phosphate oxidase superfamily flavin-nucleotide-binding protein
MVNISVNISLQDKKLIESNPVAFATVDEFGNPNVIGVAFVKVVSKNEVLITDNYMKTTKSNLERNDNVCLAVWDKDWNGIKLIGKARYFTDGKWKKFVENMSENKGLSAKGAILVTVSALSRLG